MSRGGAEHKLVHGDYRAVVTEVGGGVRLLRHAGRDLVRPYAADEVARASAARCSSPGRTGSPTAATGSVVTSTSCR